MDNHNQYMSIKQAKLVVFFITLLFYKSAKQFCFHDFSDAVKKKKN